MAVRPILRMVHVGAALVAVATIVGFMMLTLRGEIAGAAGAIVAARTSILHRLPVLILALATLGASGMMLAGGTATGLVARKRRRMRIVAANGLVLLLPCALLLYRKAQAGTFDASFRIVQTIEIAAGAINLALLLLSMRDGLAMTGRFRRRGGM